VKLKPVTIPSKKLLRHRYPKNDSKLPYTELTKIETENNWRMGRLLIGLSVGILAFSIQTFEGIADYNWIIFYISWPLLFMSFGFGLFNLHLFQRIISSISKERKAEEDKTIEKNITIWRMDRKTIKTINKWVAIIYKVFFIIGICAFVAYKYFVVTSSEALEQAKENGNKIAEIVRNQEILALNLLEIQAQIKILKKKGITDRDEILEEIKKLQVEIEEKIKKMGMGD